MFSKQSATDRAKSWANESGKPQIVYQDGSHFLATSVESYKSDPVGYRRVTVVSVIQPQSTQHQQNTEPIASI